MGVAARLATALNGMPHVDSAGVYALLNQTIQAMSPSMTNLIPTRRAFYPPGQGAKGPIVMVVLNIHMAMRLRLPLAVILSSLARGQPGTAFR